MVTFDPEKFNFRLIEDFRIDDKVIVYEYKNHQIINGKKDFTRINLYLTKDSEFVTMWFGLLEPMFTEFALASVEKPDGFDFGAQYNQDLFRGYISSHEIAACVLTALRVGEDPRYGQPQVLHAGADNRLRCDLVQDVPTSANAQDVK